LRLPYGKQTRDAAVDRLTIIAHEHFEDIVAAAKAGGYSFSEVVIPASGEPKTMTVSSSSKVSEAIAAGEHGTGAARALAEATVRVIGERGHSICVELGLPAAPESLSHPEVQAAIGKAAVEEVERARESARAQGTLEYQESVPRGRRPTRS
jgi:type III restriction enzyme